MKKIALSEMDKKIMEAKKIPLSKEIICSCCGEKFISKLWRKPSSFGVFLGEEFSYDPFCERCEPMIEKVKWFSHHRKNPTLKFLQRELRREKRAIDKLLKE